MCTSCCVLRCLPLNKVASQSAREKKWLSPKAGEQARREQVASVVVVVCCHRHTPHFSSAAAAAVVDASMLSLIINETDHPSNRPVVAAAATTTISMMPFSYRSLTPHHMPSRQQQQQRLSSFRTELYVRQGWISWGLSINGFLHKGLRSEIQAPQRNHSSGVFDLKIQLFEIDLSSDFLGNPPLNRRTALWHHRAFFLYTQALFQCQ